MKKIVHIIQGLDKGGAERFLVDLSTACADKCSVTVVCQYPVIDETMKNELDGAGIETIFLNKKKGFDIKAFFDMYKTLNKLKPDAVHSHLHAAIYAVPWYIFHPKCRKVHTIHSMPEEEFPKAHRLVQRFAYKYLKAVPVAITETVRTQAAELYKLPTEKVKLIYNGIYTEKFSFPGRNPKPPYTIINVANFSVWKNQGYLAKAFKLLCENSENYRLVFAGDGEEKASVQNLCKELNIDGKTEFLGLVDDVAEYLKKADIFVICSIYEGMPIAVLEAYAGGLPVVGTRVGGLPDIIKDGQNGYTVPLDDEKQLAEVVRNICENNELYSRISQFNTETAGNYNIRNIAEEYMHLYGD